MLPLIYISDSFTLYLYPFFVGLAWAIAFQLALYFKDLEHNSFRKFQFFFWGNFLVTWIGAKVFYLMTINNYSELAVNSGFWMGGGFVFYGGLIFGIAYSYLFLKITKQNFTALSFLLPVIPISHAIGRIGCFMAGCCYGKHTDFFINYYVHNDHRHPVPIYESIFLFGLGYILNKKRDLKIYIFSYAAFRFFIEFLRGDKIRGEYLLFSTSQWISLALVILIVLFLSFKKLINNRSRW